MSTNNSGHWSAAVCRPTTAAILVSVTLAALLCVSCLSARAAEQVPAAILDRYQAEFAALHLPFQSDCLVKDALLTAGTALYYCKTTPVAINAHAIENWLASLLAWPNKIDDIPVAEFFRNPYYLRSIDVQRTRTLRPPQEVLDARWVLSNETAIASEANSEYAVGSAFLHAKFQSPGVVKDVTMLVKRQDGWHGIDLSAARQILASSDPRLTPDAIVHSTNPPNCMQCHQLKRANDFITVKHLNNYNLAEFADTIRLSRVPVSALPLMRLPPHIQRNIWQLQGDVCFSDTALDAYGTDDRLLTKYRELCTAEFGAVSMVMLGKEYVVKWDKTKSEPTLFPLLY
jgi:hypothetical protein